MEMAHYMLHSQNMKMSFKGEVIGCETYITNHRKFISDILNPGDVGCNAFSLLHSGGPQLLLENHLPVL